MLAIIGKFCLTADTNIAIFADIGKFCGLYRPARPDCASRKRSSPLCTAVRSCVATHGFASQHQVSSPPHRELDPRSPASRSIECEHMKENTRYYRHFKGGKYKVLAIGQDSETLAPVVVYQALYGDQKVRARFVLRCRVKPGMRRPPLARLCPSSGALSSSSRPPILASRSSLSLIAGLTRDLSPPERQGSGGRTSHEYLYLLPLWAGCDLVLRTFAEV